MKSFNYITIFSSFTILFFLILFSCNKQENSTPKNSGQNNNTPIPNCTAFTGHFSIDINGQQFNLVVDNETHYSNVYNWFGYEESDFVIHGKDQNSNPILIELALPGKFAVGSKTYSTDSLDFDFFGIDIDTNNLYVSNVTFNVVESVLDADGMYKPMRANFTGTAHSLGSLSNPNPGDTVNISGAICLNTYIIP